MSTTKIHRPTRVTTPVEPAGAETIAAPPPVQDGAAGGIPIQALIPVLGAATSVTMMVVLRGQPIFMLIGALVLIVALVGGLGMAISQRGTATRQRLIQRERYLDYLEKKRSDLRDRAHHTRAQLGLVNPATAALLDLVRDPERIWERRRTDVDFLQVRIGVGDVRWFDLSVPQEESPVQPFDPILIHEAESVVSHYSQVHGMPVTVDLDNAGDVSIIGTRESVVAVARTLIAQIACLHSPDDVHLAAVFTGESALEWSGFDKLPHAIEPLVYDGVVPARRVASSMPALARVLSDELSERSQRAALAKRSGNRSPSSRLIIFVDDRDRIASSLPLPDSSLTLRELNVTIVHLLTDRVQEPSEVSVRISANGSELLVEPTGRAGAAIAPSTASIDEVSTQLFQSIARALSPLRLTVNQRDEPDVVAAIDITELLGITDLESVKGDARWAPRAPRDFLRVPIGVDDNGAPVLLDLKESAQLGMGPHGITIGATGSGKSEMLRTLILGLALTHPPEDLSMVLVDFKGGAAFAPFNGLPHVAGIIDNLADDPQLTQRARESIAGEVVRRQQVLRDAGSSPSISHYRELRRERPDLPPLPHLFIVIDEFGELLTAEPDFVDLLLTIGRIGRSIGVHLLLSSQRVEAGKLRGLETYLSYRLGLRTFSESESSIVLDTPDAYHLPAIPGFGYLKVDTSVYKRFRSGYVSGPLPGSTPVISAERMLEPLVLPPFNSLAAEPGADLAEDALEAPQVGRALIDEAVDRLRDPSRASRSVWLPPLPTRVALAGVLEAEAAVQGTEPLLVPIGLIDDPARQTQSAWRLDLSASGGHVAVIGAPQSGRSTFLRTLAASIALTHTPRQVTMYGMDLTGGGLRRIEGFAHVGGVATRSHKDRLQRSLEELHRMLAAREEIFARYGIDSVQALRTMHAAGEIPELISADIVLLVDGYGSLRNDFEELDDPFVDLLQRGGSFGIHIVLSMTRWNELRMAHQPLVGTRIELRLNDPADSIIGRKLSQVLKADQPGRMLTGDGLFAQLALPVLDDTDDDQLGAALEDLARRVSAGSEGPSAAPIRLLPSAFSLDELPDELDEPDRIPLGLRQDTMEPAFLELSTKDQHLLAFGDAQSGKSTLLRTILHGLIDRHTPDELVIALMDLRGDLVGEIPDDYLGGHASTSTEARSLATAIAAELEKRQNASTRAERNQGPRIVIIADDYDILVSGGTEPLKPLLPYLPSARDLRLHVILTRPVAGASRAMYDVVLQSIRDTAGSAFIMSGERSEGQLFPGVYAEAMLPGRGRFVRRGERPRIIHAATAETRATPEQELAG